MTGPPSQTDLLIPVFFVNLDSAGIPSPDELDTTSLDDTLISTMTRAFISILSFRDLDTVPVAVLPDLWPRSWKWIQILDRYHYFLPAIDSIGETENRVDYFWFVERFYANQELLASLISPRASAY